MKLLFGIAFVIGTLMIDECSGNINPFPSVSSILTCDPEMSAKLDNYWSTETKLLREFKKDIENSELQSFLKRSRWIQPLIDLSTNNSVAIRILLQTTSTIGLEFVEYVDSIAKSEKLPNLNATTKADVESIVSYASQFKVSMEETFLRTLFIDNPHDISGYHALLVKYKEHIKELTPKELTKLQQIFDEIKPLVEQWKNDLQKASAKFSEHFKLFVAATNQIALALRLIDPKIRSATFNPTQVAQPMANLLANIGICKKQISNEKQLSDIKTDLEAMKKAMEKTNDVQLNLPLRIENVLKGVVKSDGYDGLKTPRRLSALPLTPV